MLKYAVASALLLIGFAGSALADFYVIQNTSTKACSIVAAKDKPAKDDKTMVVVGTKNYQTVEEAEAKMKAEKACQPQ
jgi:hypothetical protein